MRPFYLAAALALVAAASFSGVAAAPARDWRTQVTRTATGSHLIGNPAARVKLVEYASYTCGHCAEFSAQSKAQLEDTMVRSGSTSFEFRHLIRDPADLAAAILARCAGPRQFLPTSQAIFAAQRQWLPRAIEYQQTNGARMASYPRLAQLRSIADGAGLTRLVQARGLSAAATNACFADTAEVDRIVKMTQDAPASVNATPSFFVNGQPVGPGHWADLAPVLRARGAK
jgi:hypothetical protein